MKLSVNLMSDKAKLHECLRAQLHLWMMIWLSLVVLMVGLTVFLQFTTRGAKRELDRLELTYEPLAALTKTNKAIQEQIKTILTEQDFVLALSDQKPIVALLGAVSQALQTEAEELFLEKLNIQQKSGLEQKSQESSGELGVTGIARDRTAVGRFVKVLRQTSPIDPLDILGINERTQQHITVHQFDIRGSY